MSSEQRAAAVEKETGRIESFSDGVFAVAITLLVFDLQVPHLPAGAISVTALGTALFKQWPAYLTFITSFATILIMWVSHHGIFKLVSKSDTPFLFANGSLLLLVTVVLFPTSPVAQYLTTPAAALACAVYAGVFVVINVAYNLLWWAASRHRRLLHAQVTSIQVKRQQWRDRWVGVQVPIVSHLITDLTFPLRQVIVHVPLDMVYSSHRCCRLTEKLSVSSHILSPIVRYIVRRN